MTFSPMVIFGHSLNFLVDDPIGVMRRAGAVQLHLSCTTDLALVDW